MALFGGWSVIMDISLEMVNHNQNASYSLGMHIFSSSSHRAMELVIVPKMYRLQRTDLEKEVLFLEVSNFVWLVSLAPSTVDYD